MGSTCRRLSLVAALAAGWLGAYGAPARAAVPAGNLIVNGNAESGTGSSDSSTTAPVPIPGWTTTPNITEHTYDPAGSGAFPDVNASAAIGGGNQFFAGGPGNGAGNTVETATQEINVSTAAAEIDAGTVTATLSADLGGFSTQGDNAAVTAAFLSAAGAQLGTLSAGPVTAADRNNTTQLLRRSASGTVPPGTRTVRVVLTATKTDGSLQRRVRGQPLADAVRIFGTADRPGHRQDAERDAGEGQGAGAAAERAWVRRAERGPAAARGHAGRRAPRERSGCSPRPRRQARRRRARSAERCSSSARPRTAATRG